MRTFSNLTPKPDQRYIVSDSKNPIHKAKFLKIRTAKHNGQIVTRASCFSLDGNFETHVIFADYSVAWFRSVKPCTAKNMETQHNHVLDQLEAIIAAAQAHYLKGTQ